MRATTSEDISVVLSGGTVNTDAFRSLGGDPSSSPISNSINNLFDDISPEEAREGSEDYRCVYIFNDGETTIWNLKFWVEGSDEDTFIQLGFEDKTEVQRIMIQWTGNQTQGNPTGGKIVFSYKNVSFETDYNSNFLDWASDLKTKIKNLTISGKKIFKDVFVRVVSAANNPNQIVFDINWPNIKDSKRSFEKIKIQSNLLIPSAVSVLSLKLSNGSPVNTIANSINSETTAPGGIGFASATFGSPLIIPRLDTEEGFPMWIKRITLENSQSKQNDKFSLKLTAQSLEPKDEN